MKLNEFACCVSQSLVLVPYEAFHVARYHQWMSSAELRQATASEPLTLDQEHQMQRCWRDSEDKLTFIVLHRDTLERLAGDCRLPDADEVVSDSTDDNSTSTVPLPWKRQPDAEIGAMIGDVNAFVTDADVVDSDERRRREFELEVMIAEPRWRGRGLGAEAVLSLAAFLRRRLDVRPDQLVAKIGDDNTASVGLFAGSRRLGFRLESRQPVFREATYRCALPRLSPPPGWLMIECAPLP